MSTTKEFEIEIDLNNFTPQNNNINRETGSVECLGRKKEIDKLVSFLHDTEKEGGGILVSGYRGVGKTFFVDESIEEYKKNRQDKDPQYLFDIRINLGNDTKLDSKTILTNMVTILHEKISHEKEFLRIYKTYKHSVTLFLFSFFIFGLLHALNGELQWPEVFIPEWTGYILITAILASLISFVSIFFLSPHFKLLRELKLFIARISGSTEQGSSFGPNWFNLFSKNIFQALDQNGIETSLKNILSTSKLIRVIYIFDEIDKLSGTISNDFSLSVGVIEESKFRKRQIDKLLGELKNLITSSEARYIFIAGREMYDAYLSESGSSNSLYESLFRSHIYIPSLLSDKSDKNDYLLDSMIETYVISKVMSKDTREGLAKSSKHKTTEEEVTYPKLYTYNSYLDNSLDRYDHIYILKIFTHFLALHSWGNYKRLITLFESFIQIKKTSEITSTTRKKYKLCFSTRDIQRLVFASQLYILFHNHLSRMLMYADDKLVVSSFSVFHFILKFHAMGFSRGHINRMYETINIHSSPELSKVVDIILHNILSNQIRRIRNSFYRYRFTTLHEKEIHFITTISDHDSAAFNFSLDAMDNVKQHYMNLLKDENTQDSNAKITCNIAKASIHVVIGNYHLWEQSYDEADIHYGLAASILEEDLTNKTLNMQREYAKSTTIYYQNNTIANYPLPGSTDYRQDIRELIKNDIYANIDYSLLFQLIEVYLKQASVAERCNNYTLAASIYLKAESIENQFRRPGYILNNDSKLDIIKQPYWSKLFLHLKRSGTHYKSHIKKPKKRKNTKKVKREQETIYSYKMHSNTDIYRSGLWKYFLGDHNGSYRTFNTLMRKLNIHDDHGEYTSYLGGNACLKAGFSLLTNFGESLYDELKIEYTLNKDDPNCLSKVIIIFIETLEKSIVEISKFKTLSDFENYITDTSSTGQISFMDKLKPDKNKKTGYIFNKNKQLSIAISLISISSKIFTRCQLHANAALSYLTIVLIWESLLEMLPWRFIDYKRPNSILGTIAHKNKLHTSRLNSILKQIESIRDNHTNWIIESQNASFKACSHITKKAHSHFMKTDFSRNLQDELKDTLFGKYTAPTEMFCDEEFLNKYIYQHYSMFGQVTISAIHWENFSFETIRSFRTKTITYNFSNELKTIKNWKILPYSTRYYSTMLWLKGKFYLRILKRLIEERNRTPCIKNIRYYNTSNHILTPFIKHLTIQAVVNLFRASQYIIKTGGGATSVILPPQFAIYYSLWEVIFTIATEYKQNTNNKITFTQLNANIRNELDAELIKYRDVSSRILDLDFLEHEVIDKLISVENLSDPNSRDRANVFRNKYYLDDDYEDNMFNLDWCYYRTFTPSALIHRLIVKQEMKRLKS